MRVGESGGSDPSGRASFEVDGSQFDAAAGTFVFVSPGVKRTAFGEESGTTVIAVGGVRSRQQSGWHRWCVRPPWPSRF